MQQRFETYAAARQAVLDTQADLPAVVVPDADPTPEVEAYVEAHKQLRAAEAAVAVELDKAWEANVAAVAAAKTELRAAIRQQAWIETEVGNAARARNQANPVLTADEVERVTAAAMAADAARATVRTAKEAFKAGVTVEQLQAVG